jgi:hypothetical protein
MGNEFGDHAAPGSRIIPPPVMAAGRAGVVARHGFPHGPAARSGRLHLDSHGIPENDEQGRTNTTSRPQYVGGEEWPVYAKHPYETTNARLLPASGMGGSARFNTCSTGLANCDTGTGGSANGDTCTGDSASCDSRSGASANGDTGTRGSANDGTCTRGSADGDTCMRNSASFDTRMGDSASFDTRGTGSGNSGAPTPLSAGNAQGKQRKHHSEQAGRFHHYLVL